MTLSFSSTNLKSRLITPYISTSGSRGCCIEYDLRNTYMFLAWIRGSFGLCTTGINMWTTLDTSVPSNFLPTNSSLFNRRQKVWFEGHKKQMTLWQGVDAIYFCTLHLIVCSFWRFNFCIVEWWEQHEWTEPLLVRPGSWVMKMNLFLIVLCGVMRRPGNYRRIG